MAIAVEHCGLHLRVALRIIKMVNNNYRYLMNLYFKCKCAGWGQSGEVDAGVHVHDHVHLHVDLEHGHHRHDVAHRGRCCPGNQSERCFRGK